MNKDLVLNALKKEKGFEQFEYFSDLNDPKNCRVCAVGALIRDLPEEKFKACVDLISKERLNEKEIFSAEMQLIADLLQNYYWVSLDTLKDIQLCNDFERNDNYSEVIELVENY